MLLVHGAFADASIWAGVISRLHLAGIDVIAPANPLRGLAIDARYIANAANGIDGPAILVGHSYGGAVITAIGSNLNNVLGLVYVAAYALEAGESALDVSRRFPDSLLAPALRPATFLDADGKPAVELYIERDVFPRVFAADLPAPVAAAAAATQRPIAATAFEETSPTAAWKRLPCWYVIATADRVITPDAQRFMADRASAQTIEVDGSHAVAASQPALVADQIRSAALSVHRLSAPPNRSDDQPFNYAKDALG
ncbi:MAG: alpha/beta hydrolase [Solirubrobacteraceae bacterium]